MAVAAHSVDALPTPPHPQPAQHPAGEALSSTQGRASPPPRTALNITIPEKGLETSLTPNKPAESEMCKVNPGIQVEKMRS